MRARVIDENGSSSTEVDAFADAKPFGFYRNRAVPARPRDGWRFIGWRGKAVLLRVAGANRSLCPFNEVFPIFRLLFFIVHFALTYG